MPSNPCVRAAIAELVDSLSSPTDSDTALRALTSAAVHTLDGVEFASISYLHDPDNLESIAPTSPLVIEADRLQVKFHEGPCYDAATDDAIYVSEDLANDRRWPRYAPAAVALGIGAQMGIDLHAPPGSRAALNLYATEVERFVDIVDDAETFAIHASLVLGFSKTVDHFQAALASRATIGQAVGIVMERYQINETRAFDFITRVSQNSNVKLREVAADMVAGINRRNP